MKTITPEQFKKLYGEVGAAQFSQTRAKPSGYIQMSNKIGEYSGNAIKESFTGSVNQVKEGYSQARNATNPLQLLEGSIKGAAGGVGVVLSPFAGSLKPIGDLINKIGEKFGNVKGVQDFAGSKAGEIVNRIVEDVANLNTIVGAVAGEMKAPEVKTAIVNDTKQFVNNVSSTVKNSLDDVKNSIPKPKQVDPVETAIKDATPNYEASTPTQKGKLLDRTQEGGILKGRTVKSNALEIEAGTELSKVPGYDPSATKLSKYQVTKAEVARRGQALEESLGKEKVVVPKREVISRVQKAVNELPNKSLLLQSSDPVIVNYMRVFKNAFKDLPGNLKGVLRLRKILDDAYENARGKQAFGSDKISALDDINKAVRDTLYEYLIEKAQSTDVKASMRSQWNLYRALDELKTAAEKESGSIVGRFKQNNPLLNKVGEATIKAAGFGAGLGIIK